MELLSEHITSDSRGDIVVSGFSENEELLGQLMTSHPDMANELRKMFRQALATARRLLTRDAAGIFASSSFRASRRLSYSDSGRMLGL